MDELTTFMVGDAAVTRIPEIVTSDFAPRDLIPEWDVAATASELAAMVPAHLDAAHGRTVISVHSWLVRHGGRTILIDAGVGNGKRREATLFNRLDAPFLDRLAAAGVAPGDVDHVLITHLHIDHVGWLTRREDERWVPTFPNARIALSRRELAKYAALHAAEGSDTPKARLFADSVLPVLDRIDPVAPGGGEVIGSFAYLSTPGHSLDHMSIALTSRGEEALFAGDVMHHPVQVAHPGWSSVFSEEPMQGEASRRQMLAHAADRNALVFTSHFAGSSAGQVLREDESFTWQEAEGR